MTVGQSVRSPLYDQAHAVVQAWDQLPDRLPDVPGLHELSQAVIRLRDELREIDAALTMLDSLRGRFAD
jgi:hypothetical protein